MNLKKEPLFLLKYQKNKMKIIQAHKKTDQNWTYLQPLKTLQNPLVLVFGNRMLLEQLHVIEDIRK